MARPKVITSVNSSLKARSQAGLKRSRDSIVPALQMTLCAVAAYSFSEYVLGHVGPIFAATSSLIALGFAGGARIRRVLEVGLGCTIGIAIGDLVLNTLGPGLIQASAVLLFSILLARFLDKGPIFASQLGLQSLLVMLLPISVGGPFARSLDAMVGGVFALTVAFLTPRDPRGEPRQELGDLLKSTAEALREASLGVKKDDATLAWHALIRARNCQPKLDALKLTLKASGEVTSLSPFYRRHRDEISRINGAADNLDLTLRNFRVFSRRLTSAINHSALNDEAQDQLSRVLHDTAFAVDRLAEAHDPKHRTSAEVREHTVAKDLVNIASRIHPRLMGVDSLEGESVIMLYRTLMVDLMQASGVERDDALNALPEIE